MKKNSPLDPKPPLHYMMGKKILLILNDPRFSQTGCDEKLLTLIISDIWSVKNISFDCSFRRIDLMDSDLYVFMTHQLI